jgi:hypothetical protein
MEDETMIDKSIMESLKQVNVSNDAEKTKERVSALWKELPKGQREQILAISGLSKLTTERACNDGRIQARLAVAFAYVLEADPFYITGRSDEQQVFEDALVIKFLKELGYTGVKTSKPGRSGKPGRPAKILKDKIPNDSSEPKKTNVPQDAGVPSDVASPHRNASQFIKQDDKKRLGAMTEDDCMTLLKSHFIQAKFDSDKADQLALIKHLLVH